MSLTLWFCFAFVVVVLGSSHHHHHHSSHKGGGRPRPRPVSNLRANGEMYANFSVECTVDQSGPHPIVTLHYKDLTVLPNVDSLFIHACPHKLNFLLVHPETHVTAGLGHAQLHVVGLTNQEYIKVSNPQTLTDFSVTYQPPPKKAQNGDLCKENQKWYVHITNERALHDGAKLVKGPVC